MSFDVLAPHYRWMEFVLAGRKLQTCRTAFLAKVQNPDRILIPGEGNGRFLVACRRRFPNARITVIDESAGMLREAQKRLENSGAGGKNVEFVRADIFDWECKAGEYDLLVTHFFLDCFDRDRLERVVTKLARAAAENAVWLLADFSIPAVGWQSVRARIIHKLMYSFFRVATSLPARRLVTPTPFQERHGFVLRERASSEWGLLRSELWVRSL